MKKILTLIITCSLICSIAGCSKKEEKKSKKKDISSSEVTVTEPSTQTNAVVSVNAELPHDVPEAEGIFVFDDANLLNKADFAACNNYAEWLNEQYLINVCVVTTDNLDGENVQTFAENTYNDKLGSLGGGMVVVINNDTNNDYIYKHGCCTKIDELLESSTFLNATKQIVSTQSYGNAIIAMLSLAETLPAHICDNSDILSNDEISELEEMCADKNIMLYISENSSSKSNDDICNEYFNRKFADSRSGDSTLIFLDTSSNSFTLLSAKKSNVTTLIADAEEQAENGEYMEACKSMISHFLSGV